ncbi:hypothetical protein [Microbispora hainanensis]|uniref:hypothetical protein n=1 Tax=Microbispora hainanensis TaxID=568844 RepID=UPI003252F882
MHYDATVRYRWTLNKAAQGPRMLAPDALVRHLLRENLADIAHKYRILDKDAAQNAMNALLGQGVQDDEKRVHIDAYVELRISKSEKAAAVQRLNEETKLRTAHARETIELDLMLNRLTDPSLGPVWWLASMGVVYG